MSTPVPVAPPALPPPPTEHRTNDLAAPSLLDDLTEKRLDEIEMIGEEQATHLPPPGQSGVTPGMRYLHASRTIHQLVTDRNRAVGIYLGVASLLMTASGALFHANPAGDLIIPLETIKRWCLPITFAVLTVLALLMAFPLIPTRVG